MITKALIVVAALLGSCKEHSAPVAEQRAPEHASDAGGRVHNAEVTPTAITVHVARLDFRSSNVEETTMPAGPMGHGGQVRDVWVAPDGTEFVTGYLYTGVPGPDTGVVYRRTPSESAFEIVLLTPEHELGTFSGRSSSDLFVGGAGELLHFDGNEWSNAVLPAGVSFVAALAMLDDEVWLLSPPNLYRTKRGERTWRSEPCPSSGQQHMVFAGQDLYTGDGPKLYHRFPDGHWVTELTTPGAFYGGFYVASPTDIYATGGIMGGTPPVLLHSTNHGEWTTLKVSGKTVAGAIWGRSPTAIYVGNDDGVVLVWRGTGELSPTGIRVPNPVDWEIYLSGNADKLVVAYEQTPPRVPGRAP